MRYPEFLKDKGTIGFVAPSLGCATEPYFSGFKRAQVVFENMGYSIDLGPNCYESCGVGISNAPSLCAQELMDSYDSDNNDIIISCGGGELMCETISYVDFDRIKKATPKWYLGYSDNTNFTFLLTTICDVASIYGPCAASFGMDPWYDNLKDALSILTGKKTVVSGYGVYEKESLKDEYHPYEPYNLTEKSEIRAFDKNGEELSAIEGKGRLIGGCMDCLVNLLGTKYDKVTDFVERYKEDGIVWFLEACDLNVFSIRRAMWQMKEAGWFKYSKMFIFGRPLNGEALFGLDHMEAVLDTTKELGIPAIIDADIGHVSPMMPLICGSLSEIRFNNGDLTVEMGKEFL